MRNQSRSFSATTGSDVAPNRRRRCRVSCGRRRSKYLALHSPTDFCHCDCARWWRVRGPCTPSAYCGLTVWRRQLCSRCSVRLSSLSLLMPLQRAGALRPPSTDSVSMLFCTELFILTCGHCLGSLTRIHSRTSATQLMINCLATSELSLTAFYMHSCHHHLSHHRTMVLDSVHILSSYLNAQLISLAVTSWCECSTRTPTRPRLFFTLQLA